MMHGSGEGSFLTAEYDPEVEIAVVRARKNVSIFLNC
jgi:hypothetical protein